MNNIIAKEEAAPASDENVWNGSLRKMTLDDYDAVFELWDKTEYVSLNECDTRDGMAFYLKHNPDSCFVAEADGRIVGTVLCGHDGRRGFLRHLVIAKAYRNKGIGTQLVAQCLAVLSSKGVGKCNIFVNSENVRGLEFWKQAGWYMVDEEFVTMQSPTAPLTMPKAVASS